MDANVLQSLPRQPLKTQPALGSAVEALSRRPEPLIDGPHPIGALHADAVLHREHLRRVHAALQPSPGDDVADLQLIQEPEYGLGLQLAVPGQQLHLNRFAQHLEEERLHELLLVHVQRCLHVAEGEALDVVEEEAQVAEAETLLASSDPCVGVPEASACVVGVSAAPCG